MFRNLNAAAEKSHLDVVQELLKTGASVEDSKKHGCKPFIMAVEHVHVEVLCVAEWTYGGTLCVAEWTYGGTVCVGEWTYGVTVCVGEWTCGGSLCVAEWTCGGTVFC